MDIPWYLPILVFVGISIVWVLRYLLKGIHELSLIAHAVATIKDNFVSPGEIYEEKKGLRPTKGNYFIEYINPYFIMHGPRGYEAHFAMKVPSGTMDNIRSDLIQSLGGIKSVDVLGFSASNIPEIPENTVFVRIKVGHPRSALAEINEFVRGWVVDKAKGRTRDFIPTPYPGYFFAEGYRVRPGIPDLRPIRVSLPEGLRGSVFKDFEQVRVDEKELPMQEVEQMVGMRPALFLPTPTVPLPPRVGMEEEGKIMPPESYGEIDHQKAQQYVTPITIGYGYGPLEGQPVVCDLAHTVHGRILGATRSGKTYATASVLVEKMVENNIPVIVIDPTDRWTSIVKPNISPPEDESTLITRFKEKTGTSLLAGPQGYPIVTVHVGKPTSTTPYDKVLKLAVPDLSDSELVEAIGLAKDMTDLQNITMCELRKLVAKKKKTYDFSDLEIMVSEVYKSPKKYQKLLKYPPDKMQLRGIGQRLTGLMNMLPETFIAKGGTKLGDIVKPGEVVVFTFSQNIKSYSGLYDAIVAYLLRQITTTWGSRAINPSQFSSDTLQRAIFIEEAHLVCPAKEETPAKTEAAYIARMEGKYGTSIFFITHNPKDLDVEQISAHAKGILLTFPVAPEVIPSYRHHFTTEGWDLAKPLLESITHEKGICIASGDAINVIRPTLVYIPPRRSSNEAIEDSIEYATYSKAARERPLRVAPARKQPTVKEGEVLDRLKKALK